MQSHKMNMLQESVHQQLERISITTKNHSPLDIQMSTENECSVSDQEKEMFMKVQLHETDIVFCPLCQKSGLEEIPNFIVCSACGMKLKSSISLKEFEKQLQSHVSQHFKHCVNKLTFSLIWDNFISLCITCPLCSMMVVVETMRKDDDF